VLEYSVAGHPFPLLRRDGAVTDLPGKPGILLALPFMIGAGYERRETELEAGDQLLFFTDGLMEITIDADGLQLGRAGLAGLFDEVAAAGMDEPLADLLARIAAIDVAEAADDDRTALLMTVH
jgi:serine phosphatase RsbU (regulator of sigma subunit)